MLVTKKMSKVTSMLGGAMSKLIINIVIDNVKKLLLSHMMMCLTEIKLSQALYFCSSTKLIVSSAQRC